MELKTRKCDLSVGFGKFKLKNPIMTASGTYGYADEFDVFLETAGLGAIVTKGITLESRPGNDGERIFETTGGMINRIGLENVGMQAFIDSKLPILNAKNINYVLNIAGSTVEDYINIAKLAQNSGIKAIEMNVSCPNVKSGCLEFGTDENALYDLVSAVRVQYDGFLIIKLTPNVTQIENLAQAVEKAGADCISAINTVKGLGVKITMDSNKNFHKTFVQGGLSGKCIKPVALSMVKRIKEASNLPIIGLGGIATLDDILEFVAVGADAVQIGTENFTHPDVGQRLISELGDFIESNGFENFENLKKELRK